VDVSLDRKVALVTGAGPNIGSGIALALSRYGARVACNDLELPVAKAATRRIERNGGVAMALPGDVSVEPDVVANIGAVLEAWDRMSGQQSISEPRRHGPDNAAASEASGKHDIDARKLFSSREQPPGHRRVR